MFPFKYEYMQVLSHISPEPEVEVISFIKFTCTIVLWPEKCTYQMKIYERHSFSSNNAVKPPKPFIMSSLSSSHGNHGLVLFLLIIKTRLLQ